jgi:alkylation response protein AidB-like acyl-CoA dehydrogenase
MLAPRAIGGGEMDPLTHFEVIEALSQADGSVGWCAVIGSGGGWITSFLRPDVGYELIARDPYVVTAGSLALPPGARAVAVDGGYRVSGRWAFASGCLHSKWLIAHTVVQDGDAPRLRPDGSPVTRVMLCPSAEARIIDTWSVMGLRGTGSNDFEVQDLFVPAERSFALFGEQPYYDGPLYQGHFFLLAHAAHALGIARAAIDEFVEVTRAKRQGGIGPMPLLRDRAMVQAEVARAEALVSSARAFAWEASRAAWSEACASGRVETSTRVRARLAGTWAVTSAAQAVDLMYTAGGGSALYTRSPLQRYFRDIHAATQHAAVQAATYEQFGQVMLSEAHGMPYAGPPLL